MTAPPDRRQVDALVPLVYERLRVMALRFVERHPSDTLQPTALVHEAWMKIERHDGFDSQQHFRAVAAKAMRQILVDRARARGRLKRGANPVRTTVSGLSNDGLDLDVVDLQRALEELEAVNPRGAAVVELRYFGGMTTPEIAEWLGLSPRTVQTAWRLSRAWLVDRLRTGWEP